jgi:hypothetical protein
VHPINVTSTGIVDRGVEKPTSGYKKFMTKPANMTNAMLKPIIRETDSIAESLWILKTLRISAPGMKMQYIVPTTYRIGRRYALTAVSPTKMSNAN